MAEIATDVNPTGSVGGDSSTPTIESGDSAPITPSEPTSQAGAGEPKEAGQPGPQAPEKETRSSKRIRQLIGERDEARKEAEKLRGGVKTPSPATPPPPLDSTPEGRQVTEQLRNLGFVTKEELAKQQDRQSLNVEYDRLEREIDGEDGRPKFDRKVIQDHAVRAGIFNPRAAYNDLFEDELREWHVKQALTSKPATPYSEKSAPPGERKPPLSKGDIEKMSPREYERRRPEIMEALRMQAL